MSLRTELAAQLSRFDDDAFAALANRGLLRRAYKDLESLPASLADEAVDALVVAIGEQRVRFDARGPAHAVCACPAAGVCQHILSAAIWLQRLGAASAPSADSEATPPADGANQVAAQGTVANDVDALADLHSALARMTAAELTKHAGKPGYRWAWQFVHDLDPEAGLKISGERHLVLSFVHPRIAFRYMGGALENLIAETPIVHVEKYRVAAVLAYQRAHGIETAAPEVVGGPRNATLDLGQDHAAPESRGAAQRESRVRLRASVLQVLIECVELGLSHLSQGIQERYATLAVWAQGAEYHRLALQLRRLADHVELLLERAGSADEHRLFDEMTLAFGLATALGAADARGESPSHLVGRARTRYEASATLELLGLGASPWRSASGYVGLTMLFWSPVDQSFFSCTDARPETQRGFSPVARYKATGPWSGLGAPAQATGRRVLLTGAQLSAVGRLSASESTSATVQQFPAAADLVAQLAPCSRWSDLLLSRGLARRSLLSEAQPMRDWVALQPARFGLTRFDSARQTLTWPLFDADDHRIDAELAYSEFSGPAISRLEQMTMDRTPVGTLVIARIHTGPDGMIAEPLSLVRTNAAPGACAVDALYFDPAPDPGLVTKVLDRLRQFAGKDPVSDTHPIARSPIPAVLRELRRWLIRQAERGIGDSAVGQAALELGEHEHRLRTAGFSGFPDAAEPEPSVAAKVLRTHYVYQQYARLFDDSQEAFE